MLMTMLEPPKKIKEKLLLSNRIKKGIASHRRVIRNILDYNDPRFMVIIGPCSFHDPKACLEYANKLKALEEEVSDILFIVMRVYVEKPRTLSGWKGYLNDPCLNETYRMQEGIHSARETMMAIGELGLPIASEILNPMSYLYFQDLLSWCAIGARTVESQPHREIASSLTFPVGFKNSTTGDISVSARGVAFSSIQQSFMGINESGGFGVVHAKGNPYAHLVLRGGLHGGNYSKEHIRQAESLLASLNLPQNIVVDCSHGNSAKNHLMQEFVLRNILNQKLEGNQSIVGVAIESFLKEGNQALSKSNIDCLEYGRSITDACLGWEDTQRIIKHAHKELSYIKRLLTQRKLASSTRSIFFRSV